MPRKKNNRKALQKERLAKAEAARPAHEKRREAREKAFERMLHDEKIRHVALSQILTGARILIGRP